MAQIVIRDLSAETIEKLKDHSAKLEVSLEDYVCQILIEEAGNSTYKVDIVDIFRHYFGPEHGIDLNLPKHNRGLK